MYKNFLTILIIAAFASLVYCVETYAHIADKPQLNKWFDKLASGKGLCCSFADGIVITDADWESKDGHYRVKIEDQWYDVPDDAVIMEPNLAGVTIVWPYMGDGKVAFIRCFMPGPMT